MTPFVVAALYQFSTINDPEALARTLRNKTAENGVFGTLIVANEGINGTIAGSRMGIDQVLSCIRDVPGLAEIEHKESQASANPFLRMKVKVKPEIVTMGLPSIRPDHQVGTYVEPRDWNALIAAEDVVVIDTRNDYEVEIGTFQGAIDPKTESFRAFPDWWKSNASRFAGKKVAMFCTGGIRCEKSTSYLLDQGANDVFHLKGGILKYLEEVDRDESLWNGACFVFDQRVAVTHGLAESDHALCFACRRPVSAEDQQRPEYVEGIQCPHCINDMPDKRRARFVERQKQMQLAAKRGTRHLG